MDNVTHSLAGVVAAELVIQARGARGASLDPRWRRAAWLVSAAAQNAPDLDFAYSWITEGKLGYLLHHRGHTHTFALAPLMALLPLLVVWAWARRARPGWSRIDHAWLIALALLGPPSHLALDLQNNYGIHPLWPIDDRWVAGDTIFIIEPLFFAAAIPLAIFATRGLVRIAWTSALGIGLLLPWLGAITGWPIPLFTPFVLAATLFAALVVGLTSRASERTRPLVALAASAAVFAVFAASHRAAGAIVRDARARDAPAREVIDVALSPLPTEPACWQAVIAERSARGLHLHLGFVSAWPGVMGVARCAPRATLLHTAFDEGAVASSSSALEIVFSTSAPHELVRELATRCDVAAFLRFSRMPFFVPRGDRWVLGDLRYDREEALGFAEMEVPRDPPSECPRNVPPWIPWRARDLQLVE